ncbi:TPA: YfbU family protein [Pseudomonas aeruginosa]
MEFSNPQKLIVTLLTDIHQALDIKDSVDPLLVQRMVNSDRGWALEWAYPGIFEGRDETPQHVKFVADVLDMWDFLIQAVEELSPAERAQLEELAPVFGENVAFDGFDGNTETELMVTARIFVDDLNRWSRFKGQDFNSHMPSAAGYERMLDKYAEHNDHFRDLTVEELAAILNERVHPENR